MTDDHTIDDLANMAGIVPIMGSIFLVAKKAEYIDTMAYGVQLITKPTIKNMAVTVRSFSS
jgi:hypothetical protein